MKVGFLGILVSASLGIAIIVGFILFFVAFYVIGFWLLAQGLLSAHRSTRAATWPTAPAVITALEVQRKGDDEATTYVVKVEYTYVVNGVKYEGSRLAFGYEGSTDRGTPAQILQRLKGAMAISARYDPSDPSVSCLSFGLHRAIVGKLAFATMWLLFVLGFTVVAWVFSRTDTVLLKNLSA
jgi:hypothetical protein